MSSAPRESERLLDATLAHLEGQAAAMPSRLDAAIFMLNNCFYVSTFVCVDKALLIL